MKDVTYNPFYQPRDSHVESHLYIGPATKPLRLEKKEDITPDRQTSNKLANQEKKNIDVALRFLKNLESGKFQGMQIVDDVNVKLMGVQRQESYRLTIYSLELDGKPFEVKVFEKGAYHGPSTEDFIFRLNHLMDAIKDSSLNPQEKGEIIAFGLKTIEKIKTECHIDRGQLEREGEVYYNDVSEAAKRVMQNFVEQAVLVFKKADSSFTKKDLSKLESRYTKHHPPPPQLHLFTIEANGNSKQFVSMHKPISHEGKLLPSTIRNEPGLVNYKHTYFGEVKGDKFYPLFQATRHTNYTPISKKDHDDRMSIAVKNVEKELRDQVVRRLQGNGPSQYDERNPLEIMMPVQMLLTPKHRWIDAIRNRKFFLFGSWKGESETKQMMESNLALRSFDGRLHQMDIDGKTVWIKPIVTVVNFGTNPPASRGGIKGKIPQDPREGALNARGMSEFFSRGDQYLRERLEEIGDPALLSSFHEAKEMIEEAPKVKQRKARLESLRTPDKERELHALYRQYQTKLKEYQETGIANRKSISKEIKTIEKQIQKKEKPLMRGFLRLQREERKAFLEEEKSSLKAKEEDFSAHLDRIEKDHPEKAESIKHIREVKYHLDEAKKAFYHRAYLKPQTVMKVQSHFIQANSLMDNFVIFFCKSATDRTGRLENKIIEEQVFYSLYGRNPTETHADRQVMADIAKQVYQYGVSYETGKLNRGMPGLQISSKVNRELGFFAKVGGKHAALAKGIFH